MGYLEGVLQIERARLSLQQGWSLEAAESLDGALAELVGHLDEQAVCYLLLGRAQVQAKHPESAREALLGAVARYVELLPAESVVSGLSLDTFDTVDSFTVLERLGSALLIAGRTEEAEDAFEVALLFAGDDQARRASAFSQLGVASRRTGNTLTAELYHQEAARGFVLAGQEIAAAKALVELALVQRREGLFTDASTSLLAALASFGGGSGTRSASVEAFADLGEVELLNRRWVAAAAAFDQALAQAAESTPPLTVGTCLFGLGVAAFFTGDLDRGADRIGAAVDRLNGVELDPVARGEVLIARGVLLVTSGDPVSGERALTEALELMQKDGATSGAEADCLFNLAQLQTEMGWQALARATFQDARAVYSELEGAEGAFVRCLVREASLEISVGAEGQARALLERAIRLAAQCDDEPLERLVIEAVDRLDVGTFRQLDLCALEPQPLLADDRYVLRVFNDRFLRRLEGECW